MKTHRRKVLGSGELAPDPRWRMLPHLHPFHELIAIRSGSMLLKTRHGDMTARAGDVLFYEAGLIHEEISVPDDPVNSLFLSFSSVPHFPNIPSCSPPSQP